MIPSFPFFRPPFSYNRPFYNPPPSNIVHNINSSKQSDLHHETYSYEPKNEKNNFSSCTSSSSYEQYFDMFGIRLYFDDILILCLLFFLYEENIDDQMLFIALLLLLLS